MSAKRESGSSVWVDPDDAPELDDAFFERAEIRDGEKPIRKGGRPLGEHPKVQVTLRLDADVVSHFKAQGPGWQTRMNATLRGALAGSATGKPG